LSRRIRLGASRKTRGPLVKISELRGSLREQGLSGLLVPKTDAYQNEDVPAHDDRLKWLSGFTGSAGIGVVLLERAALIVDSRYTLQAKAQVDLSVFTVELTPKMTLAIYLSENARRGEVIGYDPTLHTMAGFKNLQEETEKQGIALQACSPNPIDRLWRDRPPAIYHPIFSHSEEFAGESHESKLARVQKSISEKNAAALIVSAPENVAWLLNIRGGDVAHTPIPLVRAVVPASGKALLFLQEGHATEGNTELLHDRASIAADAQFEENAGLVTGEGARILVDPARTTIATAERLKKSGAALIEAPDPIALMKAKKNAIELSGAREAQKRDGVAVCKFLAWLDAEAPSGAVDELKASDKLEALRRDTGLLVDLSFDTISGSGPNGAIVHYRATPETNRPLVPGSLYLIDSGGQYRDGTTDVTRTVAIGEPTAEMKRHFTLVLKGHIALDTAIFPAGTRGVDLDPFARRALWQAGLDYGHGTGHGIGSFLSVHEGPQSISRNIAAALEAGMIVSNEPGYYREGHYGIRIENLMAVTEAKPVQDGEIPMMGFETLTLVPIDRRLVQVDLLARDELEWLNAYHAHVRVEIGAHLNPMERLWLDAATAPLVS